MAHRPDLGALKVGRMTGEDGCELFRLATCCKHDNLLIELVTRLAFAGIYPILLGLGPPGL